jgi:hypothetical protein
MKLVLGKCELFHLWWGPSRDCRRKELPSMKRISALGLICGHWRLDQPRQGSKTDVATGGIAPRAGSPQRVFAHPLLWKNSASGRAQALSCYPLAEFRDVFGLPRQATQAVPGKIMGRFRMSYSAAVFPRRKRFRQRSFSSTPIDESQRDQPVSSKNLRATEKNP